MDELPEAEVVVLPLVVAEIETDAVCDEDTERELELDEPETDAESDPVGEDSNELCDALDDAPMDSDAVADNTVVLSVVDSEELEES